MARNYQTNLILGGDSRRGIRALRSFRGEMNDTEKSGRRVQGRFRDMNRQGLTLNSTLGKLGLTLSAGFAIGATIRGFTQLAEAGDRIGKTAKNIGISAEFLQEFRGAGELAGNTVQDIDDALRRFNRRLGLFVTDGSGPAAKSIEQLGLRVKDSQGAFRGTETVLLETIDAIAALPTVAQQAAQASQLFGDDAGPKLVALLSQGSEGVEELREQIRDTGSVMSDEAVSASERYADATLILGRQVKGLAVQIFEGLIPGLTGTLEAMAETEGRTNSLASAGEGLATTFNVVVRALVIIRETALAVGEVLVGLAVTAVGTIRQIVAPIEGTIRALSEASQELIDGNFKAAARAVKGLGEEISSTFRKAQEQTDRGLGFIGESIETRVNNALEGIQRLTAGLARTGEEADDAGAVAVEALDPVAEVVRKAAAETFEFEKRLASLNKELASKLGRTVITFNEDMAELFQLFATGQLSFDEFEQLADLVEQRLNRDVREFQESMMDLAFSTLPVLVQQMLGLADATGDVTQRAGALSQIGSNFAQAVLNGQGVRSALGSSLAAFGGQGIANAFDQVDLAGFFETAFKDGIGAAFEDSEFQKNSAAGYALAISQGVEGNIGQAAFTAVGNAIGGEIGAVIGSILGDLVFGESVPKFQVRGRNATSATDAGTDRVINTAFGAELEIAFRGIEDAAKSQIIRGYSEFLGALSGVVRDPGQQAAIAGVISRFGVSSRSGPDDIEGQLNLLFDDILGTFDGFTREFVNMAETLEARVQRLSEVFFIQNQMLLGRGFGLSGSGGAVIDPGFGGQPGVPVDPGGGGGGGGRPPGDAIVRPFAEQMGAFNAVIQGTGDAASITNPVLQQTLTLLDELRIGSEGLQDTFNRLSSVVNTLDMALALTGGQIADSREGLVRFGAELVSIFGDDAGALAEQFGVIFERFFSDEERFTAVANAAEARGTELLQRLLSGIDGFDFAERFLTESGFRELFDELLQSGNLTADQLAVLSEAGVAIANLIDAQEQLADSTGEVEEAFRNATAVADILAGLETDAARRGLEGLALALFDFGQQQNAVIDALEDAGATAEEIADAERFLAMERRNIISAFNEQAIQAEQQRADQISDIFANLETDAARRGLEGLDLALFNLAQQQAAVIDSLLDLEATAEQIARAEELFADQRLDIIEDFNQRALEAEQRRIDEISEIFDRLETDAARRGLEGLDLALFDLEVRWDSLIESLEDLGATAEQIADAERFLALERRDIIRDFNEDIIQSEIEAARQRLQAQEQFLRDVGQQALQVVAPARAEFARLTSQLTENERRAAELGLSEQQLNIVRLSSQIQLQGFIASLSESIPTLTEQLFGAGDAAEEAGDRIRRGIENTRDAWLSAIDQIRDALDSQITGPNSSLTNAERLAEVQRQFEEAVNAARGGDVGAAQQATQLFNELIAQGAGAFGTSSDRFAALEALAREQLGGIAASARIPPEITTAQNTAQTAAAAEGIELSALEQVQLATQLLDQIGLLSQITEQSPSEIGTQFGIPIGELIRILTGEVPDLTGDALSGFFDNLVDEANAQLNELASLEQINLDQLQQFSLLVGIAQEQLRIFQAFEDGGKFEQFAGPVPPEQGVNGVGFGTSIAAGPLIESGNNELIIEVRSLRAEVRELRAATDQGNADRRTGLSELADGQDEQTEVLVTDIRRRTQASVAPIQRTTRPR